MKKKVTWVTPDYFVDCDFNPNVLEGLLFFYEIKWIIILPLHGARFAETNFQELKKLQGLDIQFMYCPYRQRDFRRLFFYFSLYKKINSIAYDLLYLNFVPSDPYIIPLFWALPKNITIFTAHDGEVNYSFKASLINRMVFNLTYPFVHFVNMFSPSQASLFNKNYPKAKIFTILLGLKSFGKSSILKRSSNITFLVFGIINSAKNIDLLIEAACNIYEAGYRGFKVSINGSCSNWDFYQSKIRYPEIFACDIRKIENSEIPNLFTKCHYLVQPYRMVSQSGPLKIAFNYNLPVIVSDLKGFKDEIVEGINGFFFKATDVKDLERALICALKVPDKDYQELLEKMRKHTLLNYSTDTLTKKYTSMFSDVIGNKNKDY